jgi:hypothetical protein
MEMVLAQACETLPLTTSPRPHSTDSLSQVCGRVFGGGVEVCVGVSAAEESVQAVRGSKRKS